MIAMLVAVATLTAMAQRSNSIYIEDFEIAPDSSAIVNVMLANNEITRGFQFKMKLPDGLEVDDIELTKHAKRQQMNIASNLTKGNWIVAVYPSGLTSLPADTAAVLTIYFTALPQFEGGRITITKSMGSSEENTTIYYDDSSTTVTVP